MSATKTLSQLTESHNSLTPRHGVVTLTGYGIHARVDRGHLLLEDGIGLNRRQGRFPRVGHGIKRVIVISSDGVVSLAALRSLADQDAAFTMLDREGSVLVAAGHTNSSGYRGYRTDLKSAKTISIVRSIEAQAAYCLLVSLEQLVDQLSQESIAPRS